MPTNPDSIDLGHEDEIMEAFVAYDRLVRWEEHNSRLDATEPIVERAYARGRIVALVANLAAQALGVTSDDSETTTPNTEPNPDSIVEALRAIARGHDTISGLNSGSRRWVMHIPAEPDSDPDLVLSSALGKAQAAIESLVAENARLTADLAAAEANQDALARVVDADGQLDRLQAENAALRAKVEAHENTLMWTRRLADDRYDIMRALKARHQRIERLAVIRGRCVFCSHPEDPADGRHTATCPVVDPDSDPCPFVGDSGDRCALQFEHGGSHDFDY